MAVNTSSEDNLRYERRAVAQNKQFVICSLRCAFILSTISFVLATAVAVVGVLYLIPNMSTSSAMADFNVTVGANATVSIVQDCNKILFNTMNTRSVALTAVEPVDDQYMVYIDQDDGDSLEQVIYQQLPAKVFHYNEGIGNIGANYYSDYPFYSDLYSDSEISSTLTYSVQFDHPVDSEQCPLIFYQFYSSYMYDAFVNQSIPPDPRLLVPFFVADWFIPCDNNVYDFNVYDSERVCGFTYIGASVFNEVGFSLTISPKNTVLYNSSVTDPQVCNMNTSCTVTITEEAVPTASRKYSMHILSANFTVQDITVHVLPVIWNSLTVSLACGILFIILAIYLLLITYFGIKHCRAIRNVQSLPTPQDNNYRTFE